MEVVVFSIDGQRYGVPVPAAVRVLPMVAIAPLPGAPSIALGVIDLHGEVLPVLDIRARCRRPPREPGLSEHLLVARTSRRVVVLPVDAVLGVAEVSTEAVADPDALGLPEAAGLAGIAPLADGLLFIHDLEALLSADDEGQLARALGEGAQR